MPLICPVGLMGVDTTMESEGRDRDSDRDSDRDDDRDDDRDRDRDDRDKDDIER